MLGQEDREQVFRRLVEIGKLQDLVVLDREKHIDNATFWEKQVEDKMLVMAMYSSKNSHTTNDFLKDFRGFTYDRYKSPLYEFGLVDVENPQML